MAAKEGGFSEKAESSTDRKFVLSTEAGSAGCGSVPPPRAPGGTTSKPCAKAEVRRGYGCVGGPAS